MKINLRNFLLSFFKGYSGYKELEWGDFWLVKHWDTNTKQEIVSVYTKESFKKYKEYTEKFSAERKGLI